MSSPLLKNLFLSGLISCSISAAASEITAATEPMPTDSLHLNDSSSPATVELRKVEVVGRERRSYKSDYSYGATKMPMASKDIPQSISTVTKELIQEQGALRIHDIANNVAGVNVFSTYDDIVLRGFRSWGMGLINGQKVPGGWYPPTLRGIERVEVVKGPASALFSNVVPGGVVNYVTKKPLAAPYREVNVATGSWNAYRAATDFSGPLNEEKSVLYRLNLGYENAESFRSQRFDRTLFVSPSFTVLPDEATLLNAEITWTRHLSVLDRGMPSTENAKFPDMPIGLSVSQPGDFINSDRLWFNISGSRSLGDVSLNASYLGSRLDGHQQEHGLNEYITNDSVSLYFNDRLQGGTSHGLSLYADYSVTTGPIRHNLLLGFDMNMQQDYSTEIYNWDSVGTFSLRNPTYSRRPIWNYELSENPLGQWDAVTRSYAGYVQDLLEWDPFKLLISLRQEWYSQKPVNESYPEAVTPAFIPRVGLTYAAIDDINLYATYATGFQPAEGWLQNPQYGGPFETPETSEMAEAGIKSEWLNKRLLTTLAVYQIEKNDVVTWANDSDNPDLYRQVGQIRSRGFEAEMTGKILPQWDISWNYAFNDAEITEDTDPENVGKPFENAPRHATGLWTNYRLPFGVGMGVGYEYVGERYTFRDGFMLPEYGVWNASLSYRSGPYTIGGKLNNVLDENHWTGGYYPGRTFPGAPRNWLAQMSYNF